MKNKTLIIFGIIIFVLVIVIFILSTNKCNDCPIKANEPEIIFNFNEPEISLMDETYNRIHNGDIVNIYAGEIHTYDLMINSDKNNVCIEYGHSFNDVSIGIDGITSTQVKVPESYAVESTEHKVECFKLNEKREVLVIRQGDIIFPKDNIKISLF